VAFRVFKNDSGLPAKIRTYATIAKWSSF